MACVRVAGGLGQQARLALDAPTPAPSLCTQNLGCFKHARGLGKLYPRQSCSLLDVTVRVKYVRFRLGGDCCMSQRRGTAHQQSDLQS